MEQQRQYAKIFITEKSERSIRAGHPWVYGAEITRREGACQNGGLVDVLSSKGRYLGTGFINGHSKIQVRLISRNANDRFDTAFWERRLRHAIAYRKTVMGADPLVLSSGRTCFFPCYCKSCAKKAKPSMPFTSAMMSQSVHWRG